MYGRVMRTETHIVLQYWLFYYDNPFLLPPTPLGTFWQSHEGDWEVVNVVLGADQQPLEAAYSQHCSGQRRAWDAVTKSPAGSTHPVAYVALGSHANYFAPGAGPLGTIPISAGVHSARRCADPAAAALPPGRRPGRRRPACRPGQDPPDRGEDVVDLRRTLGRVRVLLHTHPAWADPGRRGARRARAREPGAAGELEREHDPRLARRLSRVTPAGRRAPPAPGGARPGRARGRASRRSSSRASRWSSG